MVLVELTAADRQAGGDLLDGQAVDVAQGQDLAPAGRRLPGSAPGRAQRLDTAFHSPSGIVRGSLRPRGGAGLPEWRGGERVGFTSGAREGLQGEVDHLAFQLIFQAARDQNLEALYGAADGQFRGNLDDAWHR